METKTHYRKVFKSDHLGVADLEDLKENGQSRFVFTVVEVKQELNVMVAGRKGNHNIAYFKESMKPLVLNATNSKVMKSFAKDKSPFVEDWKNITIELYIDPNVKMKGDIVGGVRIKPSQPTLTKPQLTPDMPAWNNAIEWLKKDGTMAGLKGKYSLTTENEKKLKDAI